MRSNSRRYVTIAAVIVLCVIGLVTASSRSSTRKRGSTATNATASAADKTKPDQPQYVDKRSRKSVSRSNRNLPAKKKARDADEDEEIEEDGEDPDRPIGMKGRIDEAEYIRQREAFVALLRGNDPKKPTDPTARSKAIEIFDRQMAEKRAAVEKSRGTIRPLAFPNWVELGPNPIPNGQTQTVTTAVSGRVTAIEIDPTDPNKVYVGTAQGGLYRSLDGGTTWTPIFDSAQTLAIGTLNLDPANGWLWVGTGEANGSADSFAGVGLYRIENVNTTADLVGPINPIRNYNNAGGPVSTGFFTGRGISKILRVPGDPTTLFVGVAGGVIGIGGNPPFGNTVPPLAMRGLVRLANVNGPAAGITGTRVAVSTTDTGLGLCLDVPCTVNRSVNDMVLDPQDPSGNTLIVWLNGINVAGDGGIYRSTNAMGASPTFTQTLVTTSTTTSNGRGELRAYVRTGVTVIYVASGEPSNVPAGATLCNSGANFGALRRSDDGGATWSAKLQGGGGFCAGQCFYNIGFDVLPGAATTTDKLLLGGNVRSANCAKLQGTSLDGGATVFANTDVGLHADTHVIKLAPSDANVVYRGDDGGVWKSVDGGATWVSLNNTTFRATQFQSIAVHPTDPDFSIGGTQDNGTEKLTTGPTWIRSDAGDGGYAMIDQNATDTTNVTMYHTFFNQTNSQIGYSRSTNAGTNWSYLGCSGTGTTNGIDCTNTVNFYCPTALGPGAPNTVYLGTDRLYRSSTSGTANLVVSQAPLVAGVPLSSIAISPQDDNYRIVGLNNGALFYTTTGSNTLTSLDPTGGGSTIPDFYVGRLIFDPTNKNTVYIALGNYSGGTAASQSHVWKVTNLDTTPVLTPLNGSGANLLPDVPVNGFAVDPLRPMRLFAGTDIGVFISEDGGLNWGPYGQGLPRVAVFDMVIQNVKRVLRIATHGRGMWEIPLFAPTASPASISGRITTADGAPLAGVIVRLAGSISDTSITDSNGNYRFDGVNTDSFYSVTPLLANYHFAPESRSFSLIGNKTDAVFTATADAVVTANAIDASEYFVRQQYVDFLGREPDQGGFSYWTGQLNACNGDAQCLNLRRIDVSAAFFAEREFQETGSYVIRLYRSTLGRRIGYSEFSTDRQQVVDGANLDQSKAAFAGSFVERPEFVQKYMDKNTASLFVDALLQTVHQATGANIDSERDSLIAKYNSGSSLNESRALVVRSLADDAVISQSLYNDSFVLMEYFGYLRRDPDQGGLDFWLGVLNGPAAGNYRSMVCAFLTSAEYQRRFGGLITHSNADCGAR